MSTTGKLTLGPVLFNWEPEIWRDFYFRIADEAPIDSVYLGEAVCHKRIHIFEPHIADVAERLERAGKELIFSTLALVMNKQERNAVEAIAADNDFMVEANDISAVTHLKGRPHMLGPFLNIYNEDTISVFARNGARRICLPAELPASSLEVMAGKARELDIETELQVFGRMPLALSARCYHARIHKLTKDNCQFVCDKDPDGRELDTLDDEPFLTVNGIQTMSHSCLNLAGELGNLQKMGFTHFRISPHSHDMVAVANIFRDALDGKIETPEALQKLEKLVPDMPFSDGFILDKPGVDWSHG